MSAEDLIERSLEGESLESIVEGIIGRGPVGWDTFEQFFSINTLLFKESNRDRAEKLRQKMIRIRDTARKKRDELKALEEKWDSFEKKSEGIGLYPRQQWRDVLGE